MMVKAQLHHLHLTAKDKNKRNCEKNNIEKKRNAGNASKTDHNKICKPKSKSTWLKKVSN